MHRRVGAAEEEKLSQQCIFRSRLMSEETKDCFLNGFDGLQGSNQTIYAPICGSTLLHQTLLAMTVGESSNNRDRIAKCPSIATERGRTVLVWRKGPSF